MFLLESKFKPNLTFSYSLNTKKSINVTKNTLNRRWQKIIKRMHE